MEGLRFTCQPGCTNCCQVQGYVYLTEHDLRKAAAFLGLRPRVFEAKYVYRTAHLLRLRKPRHAQCHFLQESGCALHPAKPTQCRIFPFWPELVESRSAWRGVSRYCPGIGQGKPASVQGVLRLSAEMREEYPGMYSEHRTQNTELRTQNSEHRSLVVARYHRADVVGASVRVCQID